MRGVDKYSGDSKPDHWLNDYLTAVDMAGGDIGNALRYVPLCLTWSARTLLNGIPPSTIREWADFEQAFINNVEGTYQCPGSTYDLHNCIRGDKESVRNFIARWLKKRNSLSIVSDEQPIHAFINDTQDPLLCHKLGRKQADGKLNTMAQLMKVENDYATGARRLAQAAVGWQLQTTRNRRT